MDEEVEEADFVGFEFGELFGDFVGDEVAAAASALQSKLLLCPAHLGFSGWSVVAVFGRTASAGWEDLFGGRYW